MRAPATNPPCDVQFGHLRTGETFEMSSGEQLSFAVKAAIETARRAGVVADKDLAAFVIRDQAVRAAATVNGQVDISAVRSVFAFEVAFENIFSDLGRKASKPPKA